MNENDVLVAWDGTVHAVYHCPCQECVKERERRAGIGRVTPRSRLINISVEAAQLMGFIHRRSPNGSVARDLMARQKASSTP